ncbi:MAG: TetR/AcrR family transcriptional regulator [Myxococcales bacterium]|nr:TetR/AcrR family transcriptional regulator [Myxococcales bacterium]
MARTREFDLDRATDAAVACFWERGYAATSVRDLCAAMGIQPGSFYAAFGGKEACFRRALDRYLETQQAPRAAGPEAIVAWFRAILSPARRGKGCLLVSSAVERPSLDEESAALVGDRLRRLEDFFARCLDGRDTARDDAALLGGAVVAIHVLVRAEAPPARVRRLAQRALEAVGLSL